MNIQINKPSFTFNFVSGLLFLDFFMQSKHALLTQLPASNQRELSLG